MASKRIIMKTAHRLQLQPAGDLALADRSYQLLGDELNAKLVDDGLAVLEQDVLDGKVDAVTLQPVRASEQVFEAPPHDIEFGESVIGIHTSVTEE